jgi:peroxiredoxin
MRCRRHILLLAFSLVAAPALHAGPTESSVNDQFKNLGYLPMPDRPAAMIKLAVDIRALPPGPSKLRHADDLSHLVTAGDAGQEALQAVADALSQALSEAPPPAKHEQPPMPYMDLAKLVRYEQATTNLKDPLLVQATQILAANDAETEKVDFTLADLHGKKVTFSQLHGKIVLVNFWATWCAPCRVEMSDLDVIYTHLQSQGLVVLSIDSHEDAFTIGSVIIPSGYHPPVLLDSGAKVAKQFHVDIIPRTFVFDRDGKLVAEAIDMRTQRQFLAMLAKAGLRAPGAS